MRQLMISLDKKIFAPASAVARRMIEYGASAEWYIIIPDSSERMTRLSPTVCVQSSGGANKFRQFWRLYGWGRYLIRQQAIMAITTQDPFFIGLLGVWLKKQFKISLEIQLHGDFFGSNYYRFNSGLINHLRWHLAKYTVRRADRVRVAGERVKQSLRTLGVPEEKIIVRPVAVNSEAISQYQPRFGRLEKYPGYEKIFLCLGRLDVVKNINWLIDVFAMVVKEQPNYLLLVVGEGWQYKNLKSKIKNLKLDNSVKLEGWTDDPWSYLKTADALLFPSLSEGYGLVAMEAYAVGIKIIMNDVGVANYELKPSDQAIILPINDKKKWFSAILNI